MDRMMLYPQDGPRLRTANSILSRLACQSPPPPATRTVTATRVGPMGILLTTKVARTRSRIRLPCKLAWLKNLRKRRMPSVGRGYERPYTVSLSLSLSLSLNCRKRVFFPAFSSVLPLSNSNIVQQAATERPTV